LLSTIAAISTPLAASGLGVVRIAGEDAIAVGDAMFRPVGKESLAELGGYRCAYGRVYDGDGDIDEAVATVFVSPHSYTGEDTVEFSCHGGPNVLRRVLRSALSCGAKPAGPGEFTRRAFINGKMTLTQAEAVMDIISSRSEQAGKAALNMKDGALYKKITAVAGELTALQSHFAAWADFPEEDVPELSPEQMRCVLSSSRSVLKKLIDGYDAGRIVREGAAAVIAGKPNVGKSTLMNLLTGCERSIVTEIAGTTRDIVEESVLIGDIPVRLFDTAGLHETQDPVERIGVDMASDALERCDVVLAVFDTSLELDDNDRALIERISGRPSVAVLNKSDLPPVADVKYIEERMPECVRLSATEGSGIDEFRAALERVLRVADYDPTAPLMANERQLDCARRGLAAVDDALSAIAAGMTLDAVSVCVESALDALCELTGEKASDAVIDQVFSRFCVGK